MSAFHISPELADRVPFTWGVNRKVITDKGLRVAIVDEQGRTVAFMSTRLSDGEAYVLAECICEVCNAAHPTQNKGEAN